MQQELELIPKRPPHLLCVLEFRLFRKVRVDTHLGGRVGVDEVTQRGEDIHAGTVEDRGVVVPKVVRGQDRTCAAALSPWENTRKMHAIYINT